MAKSAFYRNSRFTCRNLPNGVKWEPLVMEKLPLRTFDGDVREYNEFRDDFVNLIELQTHLSPQQKLQHLLDHLAGEPRAAAEGFGLSQESYCDVLDWLEGRYGDKGVIRNTLMQDFAHIPQPTEEPVDLKKFLQNADTVIRRLRRCGIDVDDKEIYHSLLMGHLPLSLRLKLIQGNGCRGTKKVSNVLDGLRQYLSDIKEAEEHQQDTPQEVDDASVTESAETSASTVQVSSDDRLKERRTCPLCGDLHQAANCTSYPTIQKRLRRVLKLKICLLCLREGHLASVCPRRTKSSCKTCGHGQHHRILCKDADDSSRRKTRSSSQMRAIKGPSRDPANSDPKRRFRTKSVIRNATSRVTSATLRQGTQRSSSTRCKGNPTTNRKKRTRNQGAGSEGQAGTAHPTTTSSDESRKHQTAKASGNRRLLPARHGQLQTDPRSKTYESAKSTLGPSEAEDDSSTESSGDYSGPESPKPEDPQDSATLHQHSRNDKPHPARWETYYPSDDDVSMPSSHSHCSNADPDDWEGGVDRYSSPEDCSYVACASTDEQTTLLECIAATAENPVTGNSRDALIFFDSGSTRSFVSTELACELNLPRQRPRSFRVHTFGSELPSTIEGFPTCIVLRSKHRRLPPLAVIAGDCIVPSVRTALVESEVLPKLRRNELSPSPIQATPDILIGQDLVSHFRRQYGLTLPHGFYIVHSVLGPMLGGSGKQQVQTPQLRPASSIGLSL
ncbi:Zinc knuckle family protein [Aphelenchoides avenae]|nr:Zinc knuckle family protein [Aphelenchus avenae]